MSQKIPQDPPLSGYRHIYLVSQCYNPGRSHWFLWIPSDQDATIGRVIHAKGSVYKGFHVEIKDNHNIARSAQNIEFTHLAQVPASSLDDGYTPDHQGVEIFRLEGDVRDDFDIAAYALDLPRLDKVNPPEPLEDPIWNRPHPRYERCQEWTRRLIGDLVSDNKLPRTAFSAMDTATSYIDERDTRFPYNRFAPAYSA